MQKPYPALLFAAFAALLLASAAQAQTNVVLDGTSGTNTTSTAYSTTGGLNLSLGFFADYLVVAGGGSGGTPGGAGGENYWGTGGGGGGGMLQGNAQLSSSNYSVAVGAGGIAPTNYSGSTTTQGVNGSNSVFGSFTALGGGGGGAGGRTAGSTGGSGGGGGGDNSSAGGLGTTNQGFGGGVSRTAAGNRAAGGGGGGAGGAGSRGGGTDGNSSIGGAGGAGEVSTITGSSVTYAGGGGGGSRDSNGGAAQGGGAGGSGGGGAGSVTGAAGNGTNGLGGGGGGRGADGVGGNGGSGVVIVRYQGASLGNIGGTVTSGTGTAAGYTIHTFTNTGGTNFNMSGVDLNSRLGATLNGAITGSGNLTIAGPGTITLGASNSYAGTTTISSNTVRLANAGTFGQGAVTNNSAVVLARTDNFVLANDMVGSGSLTQQGSGTAALTGNNSYGGGTAVNAGTLQVGNGGTTGVLGSGAVSVATNATIAFNRSDSIEVGAAVTGNGRLTQVGAGTTTLTGINTYSGGTVISSGALRVGNGGTTGQLGGGSVAISNGASLVYDRSDAVTLSSSLSGAGVLRQTGAGALTVTGTSSHSGGTVIDNGCTLQVGAGSTTGSLGSGAVTNNGTLIYNRSGFTTFSNNISGAGSLDVTTTASFTTLSGSNSYSGSTRIRGTEITIGQNALAGSTLTTFTNDRTTALEVKALIDGPTYNVGGLAGTRNVNFNRFTVNVGGNNESTSLSGALTVLGGFNKVGSGALALSGNGNNFSGLGVRAGTLELAGGSSTNSGVSGVGVANGDVGELKISNHTLNAGPVRVGGGVGSTGTLTVTSGTLSARSLFLGGGGGSTATLNISGGQVTSSSDTRFGLGNNNVTTVDISGGSLTHQGLDPLFLGDRNATSDITLNLTGTGALNSSSTIDAIGFLSSVTVNLGLGGTAGTVTAPVIALNTSTARLNLNHTNSNYTLGAIIRGSKLVVSQLGSGTTILTGTANWQGGTVISNGTLQFGNGGAVSSGLAWNNSITNNGTLVFNSSSTAQVSGMISGTGSVVKEGGGALRLSGSNTYTGATLINGGELQTMGANRIGTNNSVTVNTSGTFSLGGSQTLAALSGQGAVTLGTNRLTVGASNSEFAGRISGAGGVTKAGEGIFTLSGSNNYKGDTIVNAGTLVLGGSNALGSASVVKVNTGGTLEASQRVVVGFVDLNGGSIVGSNNLVSALTLINSGSVSGLANGPDHAAGILKRTAGVATVDGANTFTGTVNIEAGTVQLDGGSFDAASSLLLASGATMDLNNASQTFSAVDGAGGTVSLGSGNLTVAGSDNSDFGGVISGSGKLIKSGLGTMTLTAAQSYSGGTEVTGGRLVGNTTSLTGAISNSATVEFNQESNGTLGASLTGSGALVKSGSGAMTITNAQNFTGGTSVNGGTLVVDGSVTGSTVTVNNGGTLSGSGSVGGIVVNLGGTIRPGNSPGTQPVVGNVVWNAGGNYDWEIYNAAPGGAGTTWDLISASGTLNLSALTVGSEFNINLWSLQSVGPDQNGEAINFNPNQSYTWTILTAAGGITGYTGTDQFIVNTAAVNGTGGFANDLAGGTFSVLQDGNNLNLRFTAAGGEAIPEPGTWAAAALLAGGAAFMRWRRRK